MWSFSGSRSSYFIYRDLLWRGIKNEFKIKHRYLLNGLRICIIVIAGDLVYSSQTKERLKSISKVKQSDFGDITKEFQKIFRNNPEYWQEHVARLNYLADSMKSLSASEKAQKMIDDAQGRNMFKSRVELIEGFSDATGKTDGIVNYSSVKV